MAYRLSATKLKTYGTCPQSFYFRYERKVEAKGFAPQKLGNALHAALASLYADWNYGTPIPPKSWVGECWEPHSINLDPKDQDEGARRLYLYYDRFIKAPQVMSRPLGIEQWIKGKIQYGQIEFDLRGKYDRLDFFEDGLMLTDYKSGQPPNYTDENDIQLGFYDLILEQTYNHALNVWRHIYLKTGEEVIYRVTDEHRHHARSTIEQLASSLTTDCTWTPCTGNHCDRCSYKKYCQAFTPEAEEIPEGASQPEPLQFSLIL